MLIVAIMAGVVVLYLRNSLASLVRQAPVLATRFQATAALKFLDGFRQRLPAILSTEYSATPS